MIEKEILFIRLNDYLGQASENCIRIYDSSLLLLISENLE